MMSAGQHVLIRKSNVFYQTWGTGEPVVLLHGGFGTNEDFAHQIPELAKHFRVVAFERPGHGHTADTEEPFNFQVMAEYTVDFIEKLDIGKVHIVGWSDGAVIALLVALSRPDLLKRIVPISGLFDTKAQNPEDIAWMRKATPDSFRKAMPDIVDRYGKTSPDSASHFPIVFQKTIKMWIAEPNLSKEGLAKISVPTLIVAADRDSIPLAHTKDLFDSVKDAQLSIIPGTTHFLLREKPELVNKVVLDFLLAKTSS